MSRRFFLPSLDSGPAVRLTGDEARHLARVLRCQPGDIVTLFDGVGGEADACVTRADRDAVELSVQVRRKCAPQPCRTMTLAVAPPKGDRFAWLVEKATELGVDRLIPLLTQRTVVEPGAGKLDKLRKKIVEASKQSGRSRLMVLTDPVSWPSFLNSDMADAMLLVADPHADRLSPADFAGSRPLIVAVGPEGGFSEEELAAAKSRQARLISLGPTTLRVETAAIALAACATVW